MTARELIAQLHALAAADAVARLAEQTTREVDLMDGFAIPPEWMDRALCAEVDTEIFFPEKGGSTREAKKVCALCPVRDDCLAYALDNHERHGIWGGASERDRRRIKKERAA